MEQFLIKQYEVFMHYYFWVFIVIVILTLIHQTDEEYKTSKENSIINGTYNSSIKFSGFIMITLWVMSWYY